MKLSNILMANAVVGLLGGLGFLLMPAELMRFYGANLGWAGVFLGRVLGGMFLGMALMSWKAKDAGVKEKELAAWGFFVSHTVSFFAVLWSMLMNQMNAYGWLGVLVTGFFAAAFGYHLLMKK